ncbi:hypothetical protein [Azospirillum picis]|uniref:Uncharacterized protein n=1 Tax=Azospirillum picis TaxID=488438 RepID=A0ABU0MU16_9PROT|nr:hypothetical protein [Azospirillum picis]MBP2303231.1 hypothetical protein [Azospirillum picis]MDQ0536962.1 hypothetical protein [Azospirillum picis]
MQVIDLRAGGLVHWLSIGGVVREFYDTACVRLPMVVGFADGRINTLIMRGRPLDLSEALDQAQ